MEKTFLLWENGLENIIFLMVFPYVRQNLLKILEKYSGCLSGTCWISKPQIAPRLNFNYTAKQMTQQLVFGNKRDLENECHLNGVSEV